MLCCRLYKTLQLPEGKENVILTQAESPTIRVIDTWTRAKGKQATVKCLLSALQICHHGLLVEQIEEILGVEYKEETNVVAVGQNVVDGIANIEICKLNAGTIFHKLPPCSKCPVYKCPKNNI